MCRFRDMGSRLPATGYFRPVLTCVILALVPNQRYGSKALANARRTVPSVPGSDAPNARTTRAKLPSKNRRKSPSRPVLATGAKCETSYIDVVFHEESNGAKITAVSLTVRELWPKFGRNRRRTSGSRREFRVFDPFPAVPEAENRPAHSPRPRHRGPALKPGILATLKISIFYRGQVTLRYTGRGAGCPAKATSDGKLERGFLMLQADVRTRVFSGR